MISSSDSETAARRLAFQKSYSLEHGNSWKRRSLIDDAKFDTVTNAEFEKQERRLSHADSLSEDEVFPSETNGEISRLPSEGESDTPRQVGVAFTMKEGNVSLARALKTVENSHFTVHHIESRKSSVIGAHMDVIVIGESTRDHVLTLLKTLKQSSNITNVKVLNEKDPGLDIWFPTHISELNLCNHLVTKFEPDLDDGHPGFTDKGYRARRKIIADVAFEYKQGDPIPRVHYSDDEIKTWGIVYKQLVGLFPTHACSQHIEVFKLLEKECGYSPDNIPQLEDISNFLKRKSGFCLRPAAGLLSARDFLASLAYRVFQCTQYIRHPSSPYHSPEPDCVHELLGHVPLLADQNFAQFSQEIGLASLGASDADIERFATLYWFTVEFGLIKQGGHIKACGAGLLSSYGELIHALSDTPERKPFDPYTTALQEYQDAEYQPIYFVAESFDDLKQKVRLYASRIKRPFEVRYDPFTQTVQILDNKTAIQDITNVLKAELDHLNTALCKLDNPASNFILEKQLVKKAINKCCS